MNKKLWKTKKNCKKNLSEREWIEGKGIIPGMWGSRR